MMYILNVIHFEFCNNKYHSHIIIIQLLNLITFVLYVSSLVRT